MTKKEKKFIDGVNFEREFYSAVVEIIKHSRIVYNVALENGYTEICAMEFALQYVEHNAYRSHS